MRASEPYEIFDNDEEQAAKTAALNKALMDAGKRPESIPITEPEKRELTKMNAHQRKGWMRNKPCPCGSGRKFKKCHW